MARAFVPGKLLTCWLLAISAAVTAVLAVAAQQPPGGPPAQANPLDEPINWLAEARNNYEKMVRNYTCTLIKKERVRGILGEQNVILFTSKVQPFSVHMKWVAPQKSAGQEVVYIDGRNNNKMRVKSNGIGKITGFISIDTNDRRVMEHSRHNILEAGLGNMINENLRNLQIARQLGRTQVRIENTTFDKRPCVRVETFNTERLPQLYCGSSVLYLEKESKLPMRLENYDWRAAGAQTGELLEEFSYMDLRFNVDVRDELFNK